MAAMTRGPLPPQVYWRRRLAVLGIVALLVLGVARLVGGGEEPATDRASPSAVQAAAEPESPRARGATRTEGARAAEGDTATQPGKKQNEKKKKDLEPPEPVLAEPEGDCVDQDLAVTPTVDRAVAGRRVLVVLELRTIESPACTWRVSPETLTLKVTSGDDDIWSTRECPRAIPTRDVVVRKAVSTKVGVRWSGRRADDDCTRYTDWAQPGWYHVAAAALAGEPSDVQFELVRATRVVESKPKDRDRDRDRDKTKARDKHVAGPGGR